MNCSIPGLPYHHQNLELAQTCPLSQWCHPTISSSVIPFSFCLQPFPESGSFPMSQFFASGGQSIGDSASPSVLPRNIQDWLALGLTGWISLQSKGLSRIFPTSQFKSINSSVLSFLYIQTLTSIHDYEKKFDSVQFSSVTQSCPTLCNPMNHSTPGLPVHHQLPEFTQTHAHLVDDAIQPSHPLSSPSPPAPNPSKHQGLFQWVNSSHEVAKVWTRQTLMHK